MLGTAWDRVLAGRADGQFDKWRDDPVGFIETVLGVHLWGRDDSPTGNLGQREIARTLGKHDSVTVRTCHGAGKTFLAACLALWFWITRPNSIVVSTAPTVAQVRDLLWREIRERHSKSHEELPGRVLTQRAEMEGNPRWYMMGFSVANPIDAQGKHADGGLLFIGDEASGIPDEIFDVTRGYRTGGNAKRLYIGNPNVRHGRFHESHEGEASKQFKRFHISAFDVPEKFGDISLMSRSWIENVQLDCGHDFANNPLYQVQVLGEWPTSDSYSLVPLSQLEDNAELRPEMGEKTIGVDIARLGVDKSVAYLNDKGRLKARHEWTKARTHESAEIIAQLMEKWGVLEARNVKVDASGVGGGVVDDLFRQGLHVEAVDFGAGPRGDWSDLIGDTVKFRTRRSELHYVFYKLMQARKLSIPNRYQAAWSDAVALRQLPDETGYFKIEPKDAMRLRVGHSPDDTDAIICSLSQAGSGHASDGAFFVIPRRRRRATGGRFR